MGWARRERVTGSASSVEVDVRAIPLLRAGGWKLYSLEEWPLIGAAPKNYLAYGDPEKPDSCGYIAKKGRLSDGGARECVSEEIISKVGAMLPVRMAESKLVRLPVRYGAPPDVRFLSRNFLRRGDEVLMHGIEIVANYFNARPEEVEDAFDLADKRAEQSFYTIDNVVEVLRWFATPEERAAVFDAFARMLAFDALVGAPDRHALNWGAIVSRSDPPSPMRFAPLYDTARGVFREHTDQKLEQVCNGGARDAYIRNYAEKSRPIFGMRPGGADRCNHFELIAYVLRDFPDELGRSVGRFVNAVNVADIETMVRRQFRRIITPLRTGFIADLLRYRDARLKSLVESARG